MNTEKLTAIIVDDEESSRETLSKMLNKYCPDVQLMAKAENADEAFELIEEHKPDLVFLDVEMPHATGFDLLERFTKIDFNVVFTTAYDQYAINAIKFNALDYLMKPINIKELIAAVNKVLKDKSENPLASDQIKSLIGQINQAKVRNEKVGISTKAGVEFIAIEDVIRCEADGNYTKIFFHNSKPVLATGKIKTFESLLAEHKFVRVHNSHLININYLEQYIRGEGGLAIMSDGSQVPISRRKKEEFLGHLYII